MSFGFISTFYQVEYPNVHLIWFVVPKIQNLLIHGMQIQSNET